MEKKLDTEDGTWAYKKEIIFCIFNVHDFILCLSSEESKTPNSLKISIISLRKHLQNPGKTCRKP